MSTLNKPKTVGLHDADGGKFPNLALMKLSAYHKRLGDVVSKYYSYESYDVVYSSKVFTYTEEDMSLPDHTIRGGIGYGEFSTLPEEIEHICPDYSLYNIDYSLGFLTRGCNRKCPWCFVPGKEGTLVAHADIEEFLRHRDVVLMDNNPLASDHGVTQIEKIAGLKIKVDFNQGLDARLIDDSVAKLLAKVKWLSPIRLACDTSSQIESVEKAVKFLRWHNATPRKYFVYALLSGDEKECLERIKFLKGLNLDPFAQPYRDAEGSTPPWWQRQMARWVNMKAAFNSCTWDEYYAEKSKGVLC